MTIRLALGADSAGTALKNLLRDKLKKDARVAVRDFGDVGDEVAYPHVGLAVAEAVARGEADRAILICGTGIGMAISANKVPGIRAAQAHDTYSAERASKSNDAQIITIGARVVGIELAKSIVQSFLNSAFEPRSLPKIEALSAHEKRLIAAAR